MTRFFNFSLVAAVLFGASDLLFSSLNQRLVMHPDAYAQATPDLGMNAQLLVAARNDDLATVRRVLDNGALPDSRNRAGDTALMIFVRKGNAEMVDLLIGKGANVNLQNLAKVSPLMAAAHGGNTGIARTLIDHGADVNASDQLFKTAMVYAAGQGNTGVVALLLDAGVDVNKTYHHDLTALMWAAGYGKTETVKLLLARGADPALKDDRGKTAGEIARDAKHEEVAELLKVGEWGKGKSRDGRDDRDGVTR